MRSKILLTIVALAMSMLLSAMAQNYYIEDDIYYTPNDKNPIVEQARQEKEVVVITTTPTSSNTATSYTTYTVKKGDSLWKISKKLLGNGTKYTQIQKANGLSSALIRVGQKLKIPKG